MRTDGKREEQYDPRSPRGLISFGKGRQEAPNNRWSNCLCHSGVSGNRCDT